MAEKENQRLVERIRYPLIIGLLLSSLVFMLQTANTPASGGSDLPNELTQIQNGTATVTVTGGTTQGTATITYGTSFAPIVPKLFVTPQALTSFTTSVVIPNPTAFFQAGTTPATIWTNMPAADSEIYGDANGEHQIEINLSNMASFRFAVSCVAPSNTPGAYLTIMYFSGGVWTEMNSAQRFLIDGTGNGCPNGGGEHYASPSYSSIPSAAKISTQRLRVDGVGGGGLGDVPSFSALWLDWSSNANGNPAQTIGVTGSWRACATLALCVATPPVETLSTGFIIAVTYPIAPAATQTLKFTWKAGIIV